MIDAELLLSVPREVGRMIGLLRLLVRMSGTEARRKRWQQAKPGEHPMGTLGRSSTNGKPVVGAVSVDCNVSLDSPPLFNLPHTDIFDVFAFEVLFTGLDHQPPFRLVLDPLLTKLYSNSHTC